MFPDQRRGRIIEWVAQVSKARPGPPTQCLWGGALFLRKREHEACSANQDDDEGGGAVGDLNRDTFSSKNQGVDGPGARAEHGQTDGENSNQNMTLVLHWT